MKCYNQLQSITNSIKLVGCLCFIIILTSCAPSADTTTSRPTDNSATLASLIMTSNPEIAGLNVNVDNSDPANPKLAITGITNSASGDPVTATIGIDQDKGITTDPTSFTVTAPAVISPHEQETNLMVTFGSEPPVSYTVTTQIRGAAVSEWFTSETISTYVKATFASQGGIVALAETTISVAGLTNTDTGTGEITFELPAGFTSDSSTIEIPDPDGTGTDLVMSTPNPNTFKITETGNTGNSVTYTINDIELAQLDKFTPGTHIKVTEGSSTDLVTGLIITTDTATSPNKITITGLTNKEGANTYTLTIDEVATFFTTPGNTPIVRTITEPTVDFSGGAGTVTDGGTAAPTFEITNVGESATTYTLEVVFTEVAVNEWFPAKFNTYITGAYFAGQAADTWALNEGTIAISHSDSADNFTNVPNGMIVFTKAFPDGYELVTTALKDPDGEMLAAVTDGDAGMITITETGNNANSQTYPVTITLSVYKSPFDSSMITITTNGVFAGVDISKASISLDTNEIIVSGFTNSIGTMGTGTVDFPLSTNYTLSSSSLTFNNPTGSSATNEGIGMITVTSTRTGVSVPHHVTIMFAAYQSPLTPGDITATYGGVTALLSDKTIETNMITISGFTNRDTGTAESGTVTVTAPTGYTVTPPTLNISDPAGASATNTNIGTVTVTNTSTGGEVSHSITVEFLGTRLRIAGGDITSDPSVSQEFSSGSTISITTAACQLLTVPTTIVVIDAANNVIAGSKVADATPFPRYYDRERDTLSSGKFSVTRNLTLEDGSGGVLSTGFTITLEFPACTSFPSGQTGADEATAYQIDSAPMLDLASHLVNTDNANYGDKYYKVTANIDMGLPGLPLSEMGSGSVGKGFNPIGMSRNLDFTGNIDCDNKEISNFYVNRDSADNLGLFGYALNATIANCRLITVKITGRSSVGGLVGVNNNSMISNSRATGVVLSGTTNVGGLVGVSTTNSTITNSYATGSVTGSDMSMFIGGLVGRNISSVIESSYADGQITAGNSEVGGLVGVNDTGSRISESYATVSINATSSNVGGLVGSNSSSTISDSYATGAVTGTTNVGGLVGWALSSSSISKSYATGAVTGTNNVGGLVGFNSIMSTISNSYATGAVSGNDYVGGLAGYNFFMSTITNAYATGDVSGLTSVGLFIGYNGEGNPVAPTGNGVTASYFRSDAVLTVGGSVSSTPIGVGSDDATATPSVVTANLTGQTTAELQSGTAYSGWDATTIWEFASGQYPRLR